MLFERPGIHPGNMDVDTHMSTLSMWTTAAACSVSAPCPLEDTLCTAASGILLFFSPLPRLPGDEFLSESPFL